MRALLLVCLLAGCLLPDSAEVSGSGVTSERQVQTVRCATDATLDRYAAGGGAISIRVFDGDGRKVYDDASSVAGQIDDTRDLGGGVGTWTLAVDAEGFAGQFKISLACL